MLPAPRFPTTSSFAHSPSLTTCLASLFCILRIINFAIGQFDMPPPLFNGNGHQQQFGGAYSSSSPYQLSPPLYGNGGGGQYGGQLPYSSSSYSSSPFYQPSPFLPPPQQPLFGTGYPMFSPTNSYVCIPYCPPNKYGNGNSANLSPYGYGIGGGGGPFGPFGQGMPPPPFGGMGGSIGAGTKGNGNGGGFQYGGKGFFGQLPGGGFDMNQQQFGAGGAIPNSGAYIQTEQGLNGLNGAGGLLGGGPGAVGGVGMFGPSGGLFGGHRRSAKNVGGVPFGKVEELKSSNSQQQQKVVAEKKNKVA